jgi:toxin YhaV
VGQLASQLPEDHKSHARAKFLAQVQYLIFESIPSDPNRPEFRQGNTLGADHRHWFRAKFNGRYRLFFRFSSKARIIVYAWINDESTLRKAGSKRDPYAMFRAMLEAGDPPRSFEDLVRRSKEL